LMCKALRTFKNALGLAIDVARFVVRVARGR
jgi:hypothetical protein